MGALVTLELPADSPVLDLPWIITFGPLSDEEEWEPVVCGPYERLHAIGLAESVVADDELMAVVEPLLPHVAAQEIKSEIAAAKLAADAEVETDYAAEEGFDVVGAAEEEAHVEPSVAPSADEIRAGMARIAAQLTTTG